MNIGQRIREVREDLGMQAAVLARRVEVAPNTIYRIEAGDRTPSVGLLEKIARELRTEPAELLREPVPLAEAPPPGPGEVAQADYDPYRWIQDKTTEELQQLALEEAQYAKAPVHEEWLAESEADREA